MRTLTWLIAWTAVSIGCATEPGGAHTVRITPDTHLLDLTNNTVTFEASVVDGTGASVPGARVRWQSTDPTVATIDSASGVAVALATGVTTIEARSESATATARLEVYVEPLPSTPIAGNAYLGRNDYVEYVAGDLPIVIGSPHGGYETPAEIADRTFGVTGRDGETQEIARAIAAEVTTRTGRYAHLIVSRLSRIKLDPNREIAEAAQDNPFAEHAWREYHGFVDVAKATVESERGAGLFIDIHGHGHDVQRIELGYLLDGDELALGDQLLNQSTLAERSSLRALVASGHDFAEVLRGPSSLGSQLEDGGYPAVPSGGQPDPGGDPYFTGGYSTARHGSRDGGSVSAIQIEINRTGIRDGEEHHAAFVTAFVNALDRFLETYYSGCRLTPGGCPPPE